MKTIKLNTGAEMPQLGYGTWQASDEEITKALELALECGYRHIDTAAAYNNEKAIGKVISQWISDGKLTREQLFIVTKLPPNAVRPSSVEKYLKRSLSDLQVDYLDLYLIHTPFTFEERDDEIIPFNSDGKVALDTSTDLVAVWQELEKCQKQGLTKAIGISNFNVSQIKRIIKCAKIQPASLQIEMHLKMQQKELIDLCKKKNIAVTAYSPLGSGGTKQLLASMGFEKTFPNLMTEEDVVVLAKKYNKTPAQILLKHIISKGIATIPKSTNVERIKQNIEIFDFELTDEDISKLDAHDQGDKGRILAFEFMIGVDSHPEYPFKKE